MLSRLAGQETKLELYFGEFKYIYCSSLIMIETLSETAWVMGDLIIAMTSIILHRYFEVLQEQIILSQIHVPSSDQVKEDLRQTHLAVSSLSQATAKILSPLVLVSVGCNVAYILFFLYSGLEEDLSSPHILVRFIFTYSFVYLILRFTVSIYLASRLAEMVKISNFSSLTSRLMIRFK